MCADLLRGHPPQRASCSRTPACRGVRLAVANEHTEVARTDEVLGLLAGGHDVAVVTDAGTPGISDPGERLVARRARRRPRGHGGARPGGARDGARAQRLRHDPVRVRGVPASQRAASGAERLAEVAAERRTVGALRGTAPHRRAPWPIWPSACGADRRVALARELTKLHEEVWRGTLGEASAISPRSSPRGEYVVVVEGAPAAAAPTTTRSVAALRMALAAGADRRTAIATVMARIRRCQAPGRTTSPSTDPPHEQHDPRDAHDRSTDRPPPAPPSSTSTARSSAGRARSCSASPRGGASWFPPTSSCATPSARCASALAAPTTTRPRRARPHPRCGEGCAARRPGGAQRRHRAQAASSECAPKSQRLIEQHRHAGRATYIVSASPVELVEPLAKALGMTAGIGTRSDDRRRRVHRRARRAVLLRRRARWRRSARLARVGGSRPRPVLGLQRLGQRPADAARRSATRWR